MGWNDSWQSNLHMQVLGPPSLTLYNKIGGGWLWNQTQCTALFQPSQNAQAVSVKDIHILQGLCGNQ